jgi:hypothetical protein
MSDVRAPQPGWYADPENPAGERWWNGSAWSDHKRGATQTGSAAPTTVTPLAAGTTVAATPDAGFTFGSPTPVTSDPRPDPYAPPAQGVATPYYSSPYVGAPYGAPAYGSGVNGLALAGLLVSAMGWLVLSVLGPIAGIILSAFGLRAARQREAAGNPNSGRGLAMAGLVVGIILLAFITIAIVAYIAFVVSLASQASD